MTGPARPAPAVSSVAAGPARTAPSAAPVAAGPARPSHPHPHHIRTEESQP
ncbi:hypothetical protein ACIQRZ_31110 [Streptomyces rubiginosohelvolus]|uniref:hypothetical protein n=1 Tax=Streptomyces rubiginosohelvolus TaxID=67362 RepID=UPI0038090AF9